MDLDIKEIESTVDRLKNGEEISLEESKVLLKLLDSATDTLEAFLLEIKKVQIEQNKLLDNSKN